MKKQLLLILLVLSSSFAQEEKLEMGAAIGYINYPSYIGSKSRINKTLPFPYIYYQSDKVSLTRSGLKAKLFNYDRLHLGMSISGMLPVESDGLRTGMNKLMPALEVGPEIEWNLLSSETSQLNFKFPLRGAIATDFSDTNFIGYLFEPKLSYSYKDNQSKLTLSVGPVFATKDYFDYYYEVKPEYVTTTRNQYSTPKKGYGGFRYSVGYSYKIKNYWFGSFVRYYNINNAVFRDSPLVETNKAFFYGASFAYIFYNN